MIRLPKRAGGFVDTALAQFKLTTSRSHANCAASPDLPDMLEIDTNKSPRLLLFVDSHSELSIKINYMNIYFC